MHLHNFFSSIHPLATAATASLLLSNAPSSWAAPTTTPRVTHRISSCKPRIRYYNWKITFDTLDWAKKGDTAVTVDVLGQGSAVAHYKGFGASDNSHCTYDKGDHHVLALTTITLYPVSDPAVQLHLRIDPPGKDTWSFHYILTALSVTGTWRTIKSGYGLLDSVHRDATIN